MRSRRSASIWSPAPTRRPPDASFGSRREPVIAQVRDRRQIARPEALMMAIFLFVSAASAIALAGAAPRAADGHPDLSGVWTNASVTHLTRAPGVGKLVLNAAEARAYEKNDGL